MIEDDSWREIYQEWREIRRIKQLNQELYDLLFGSIHYIIEYSKKYNIPIKNREQLVMMSERIHRLMDEIEPSTSDENLQKEKDDENRRRLDSTASIGSVNLTAHQISVNSAHSMILNRYHDYNIHVIRKF